MLTIKLEVCQTKGLLKLLEEEHDVEYFKLKTFVMCNQEYKDAQVEKI
jgi:hypothetical protein